MAAPRLLYLVTEDWYFLSHRLPMARAARNAGYEVHVATRVTAGRDAIEREGFVLHALGWSRRDTGLFALFRAARQVRRLYKTVKPALVHHVAVLPTVVGSLAVIGLPVVRLNALTGLGFVFTARSAKARALRAPVERLLGWLLRGSRAAVLVQNNDDKAAVERLGVPGGQIALIPGSGVDTVSLAPMPEPDGPIAAGFVGRLLADKGVRALVEAAAILKDDGEAIRLLLAGEPDAANPSSMTQKEIDDWRKRPELALLGHVPDIRAVWSRCHIAVLPSRREGLPLSLLEAAACGRPIVATDVPGCRAIARDGVNALLVPPDDPQALAKAISRLAHDPALRARFGAAGRALVENEFSSERIGREIVALYDRLLGRERPA
jgi:glycosyltransferase involved in cell wall biosynthesis